MERYKIFKFVGLVAVMILFSACSHRRVQPQSPQVNASKWASGNKSSQMWTGSQSRRDNYNPSKPEPFSKESGQSDPEVLGPQ